MSDTRDSKKSDIQDEPAVLEGVLSVPASERRLVLVRPPREGPPGLAQRFGRGASRLLVRAAEAVPPYAPAALAARGVGRWLGRSGQQKPQGLGPMVERWLGEDPWNPPAAERARLGLTVLEAGETKELWLPPGHPQVGHLYAAHPLLSRAYLPMERYHPTLFEQKLQEALTLVAALGAVHVRARCARGYSAWSSAGAWVGTGGEALGAEAARTQRGAVGISVEEHYPAGRTPTVPEGLVWLAHEPAWAALARRRLESGMERFFLELRYTEDYGVNGSMAASLEGVGIRLGGGFREFEETVWHVEGEFG